MKKYLSLILAIVISITILTPAFAIPALQLYIEGAEYNTNNESWVISADNTFKLWILGDVGNFGSIYDVKLVTAYKTGETGSINLSPTTVTSGLLPFPGDSSIPQIVTGIYTTGSNDSPVNDAGTHLPAHGIYGDGVSWNTYQLGNFTAKETPIGDYTNGDCPDGSCAYSNKLGQINAYNVTIDGYSWVHFDAFDHVYAGNKVKYIFAPFSHDAVGSSVIPEPATLTLFGLGLLGLAGLKRKKDF